MEEAHQIVLQALEQAGVGIPAGADSLQDLSPSALVGLCRGALARIEETPFAAPAPFPVSMAERFRVCSELAASIKHLGFKGDLSFQQFLYPLEEESYNVLSFLLDKLSKCSSDASGGRKRLTGRFVNESISSSKPFATPREALSEGAEQNTSSGTAGGVGTEEPRTSPFRLASIDATQGNKNSSLITVQAKPRSFSTPLVLELNYKSALMSTASLHCQLSYLALEARNTDTAETGNVRIEDSNISSYLDVESNHLSRKLMSSKQKDMALLKERFKQGKGKGEANGHVDLEQRGLRTLEERLHIILIDNSKLTQEIAELKEVINKLVNDCEASSKQTKALKEKHDLIKIASEMALDSTQTEESKLLQLKMAIEESQQRLADSKFHWESVYAELERKKSQLELSDLADRDEVQAKVQELKNIRQQISDTTMKLKQREEQINELTAELEKGKNGPLRSTYVSRITELIKNNKKQDTDISRILGETRDLQRESNTNQGRLNRTYALVDELVFRDAKKDPVCRQAYRLLTSIHQDFSDCYDKVFAMDKIQREITDLQATLETMEKRPVDFKKIQADFDALVAENLSMEKHTGSTSQ